MRWTKPKRQENSKSTCREEDVEGVLEEDEGITRGGYENTLHLYNELVKKNNSLNKKHILEFRARVCLSREMFV